MKHLLILSAICVAAPALARGPGIPAPAPIPVCEAAAPESASECHVLQQEGPAATLRDGQTIRLVHVQDSRCPADVNCVWAGFVTATFLLEAAYPSTETQAIELSLDPRYAEADTWTDEVTGLTILLNAVSPNRVKGQRPPVKPYARITVTQN